MCIRDSFSAIRHVAIEGCPMTFSCLRWHGMCICMYLCMYIHTYMNRHMHMHMCMYMCMYMYIYVCMCM